MSLIGVRDVSVSQLVCPLRVKDKSLGFAQLDCHLSGAVVSRVSPGAARVFTGLGDKEAPRRLQSHPHVSLRLACSCT